MCGIFAVFGYAGDNRNFRAKVLRLAKRQSHRGPDWTGAVVFGENSQNALVHDRLAIVDPLAGNQPFISTCNAEKNVMLIANGEIYNHEKLRAELTGKHKFQSSCDSEVIVHLYEEYGDRMPNLLDGDFAFVITDGEHFLAARDPIGVVPMYQGFGSDGSIWFSSEMKTLTDVCERIISFPAGHYYSSRSGCTNRWFKQPWIIRKSIPQKSIDYQHLRQALINAVHKRLMSDVPYGVILSGGLDSGLVTSIMARHVQRQQLENALQVINNQKKQRLSSADFDQWQRPLVHSFSIGLPGGRDLIAARQVAEFLGTVHHECIYTVQEGIDCIPDVIYHLESYDLSPVRSGIPMFLLARHIKASGVKMVLSGEGSDEIFGGYLYFSKAPNEVEFHTESVDRLCDLQLNHCLRSNKAALAWGVEVRVPYLDRDFLDVAMAIDPREKMVQDGRMEKFILRKAFDSPEDPYLPQSILWRRKEQISDGVGYTWNDSLKAHCQQQVTDEEFEKRAELFPIDTPTTKEAFYYRKIFAEFFPDAKCQPTVKRWGPRTDWGCKSDPSGLVQDGHHQSNGQSKKKATNLITDINDNYHSL